MKKITYLKGVYKIIFFAMLSMSARGEDFFTRNLTRIESDSRSMNICLISQSESMFYNDIMVSLQVDWVEVDGVVIEKEITYPLHVSFEVFGGRSTGRCYGVVGRVLYSTEGSREDFEIYSYDLSLAKKSIKIQYRTRFADGEVGPLCLQEYLLIDRSENSGNPQK